MLKTIKIFARHHFTDRPFDGPIHDPYFKIKQLDFDLAKFNKKLESLGAEPLAHIMYKNKKYPIYYLDFKSKKANAKKLFIVAGTHGNEQGGLLGAEKIIDHLIKLGSGSVSVRVVAAHNPVGCDYFSRYNGEGIDVNRDFKSQQTVETQAIIRAFNEFNPDFGISLHEGPQTGTFLYTNKHCDDAVITDVLSRLNQAGILLATKSYLRNTLTQPGRFPINGIFESIQKIWSISFGFETFGQFCTRMGVPSIVIETSWASKEQSQRINAHFVLFTALLTKL